MNTPTLSRPVAAPASGRRGWILAGSVLAGAAGLWWGYGFGDRLGGLWLGLVAAANCGALCTFMADAALSRLLMPAGRTGD